MTWARASATREPLCEGCHQRPRSRQRGPLCYICRHTGVRVTPLDARALAFELIVLGSEGGAAFTNDSKDPGGPTRFGVSWRAVRLRDADFNGELDFDLDHDGDVDEWDIRQISLEMARDLFYTDYWVPSGGERLPPALAVATADAGYNQGPRTAVALLQRALKVKADGIVGPVTVVAAQEAHIHELLPTFGALRLDRYRSHPQVGEFFRGWARRVLWLQYQIDERVVRKVEV